jgi:hypothetical protein
VLKHYGSNLLVDLQIDAKKETLQYIKDNMADAPYFEKHPQLVEFVVNAASLPGLYLEFGVGRGKSIRWIGSHADRTTARCMASILSKAYRSTGMAIPSVHSHSRNRQKCPTM